MSRTTPSLLVPQRQRPLRRAKLGDTPLRRLAAAAAAGEIRCDLPVDPLAGWIVRIHVSLIAQPARPDDDGGEGLLRNLLVAWLNPGEQPDRRTSSSVG